MEVVSVPAPPLPVVREPVAYRILSRVEGRSEDETVVVEYEEVVVRRPWESLLVRRTRREGGRDLTVERSSFGRRVLMGTGTPLVLALPPSPAAADVRVAPVLDDAVAAGLAERREQREVAERRCQVLRTRSTLAAATLEPPTAEEYADSCVDEAGLVLEEVLVMGGKVTRRRVALEVDEAAVPAAGFAAATGDEVPPPVSLRQGGGSIRRLLPSGGLPEGMFLPPSDPPGFTFRGRYSAVPPQGENFTDPTKEGARLAGVVDVWERGSDYLVLDQGATLRGLPAFPSPGGAARTVDIPGLGMGEILVSFRAAEIRIARQGGQYLRVFGSRPVTELEALLRSLQPVPGRSLDFSEEPL